MKVLVGWNSEEQADLIGLYLGSGEGTADITTCGDDLFARLDAENWDIVLISTELPDQETGFQVFCRIREEYPDLPVVAACPTSELFRIARFMTKGLRAFVPRDESGDFVFILHATLEAICEAVKSERERKIAEKLREEVDSVRKLQRSILPQDLRSPDGYDIVASYEPSQIRVLGGQPVTLAGGDYYDVFPISPTRSIVLVGDAAGHGMKACISILTMHTLVRMIRTEEFQNTASFVREVNRRLCQQTIVSGEGGFITMLYGVLHSDTHEFRFTCAGHPVPLLHHLDTDEVSLATDADYGGMPLAIYEDAEYEEKSLTVPPNSRLLLYTDGLAEAFPEQADGHTEFGIDGISQTLKNARSQSVQAAMQALFDDSNAFTKGLGRHDDTSIVLIERD